MGESLWLIGLGSLWLGAWQDWRSRTVTNRIWQIALALSLPFLLWELFRDPMASLWRLASAGLTGALAWALWQGGQLGGADAKAVMVAGLLLSPFGYLEADAARFIPILDALLTGLILAEAWRRFGQHQGTPFLVVLAPLATLTLVVGGLLWWPVVAIGRIMEAALL